MTNKKLYLVDGTSLCYRSHFAISLSNSSGFPTGAIYGFYKTLEKIISEHNPEFIGVCFDISKKTYRQAKYKDYKIQRPPLPDELGVQLPVIKKLVKALGIEVIEKEGFEADDIIASLSKKAVKKRMSVVVVSSDKDFCQLLAYKGVAIYNYQKQKFYQSEDFIKKYGFNPSYMADYLSLTGDASDNIPGARGIGKVGAAKLVKEFGDIDNIFKNLDRVRPKEAEKLKQSKEEIVLSKELVEFMEPGLSFKLTQLKRGNLNRKQLIDIFSELEFKIPKDNLSDEPRLDLKLKENFSTDLFKSKEDNQIFYFISQDKAYIYRPNDNFVYRKEVSAVKDLLEDSSSKKVTIQLKLQMLEFPQINFRGSFFDIDLAVYLLDSSISDYSLVSLVALFLGEHYSEINLENYPYFIWRLYKKLSQRLRQDNLEELFYQIEMPLVEVLYQMEANGISMDSEKLKRVLKKVAGKIKETEKTIFKEAQEEFNLNSPKQLQEILFRKLGIKPLKKTKTGYSTKEEVLKELALEHSIASDILQHRELSKLKNTYLDPLLKKVEASGGKLFTHFNQTGTQTGRLSSSSPNLQSIPIKGEFSSELREAFVSSFDQGYIVCGDYSQIELRILAHLSEDKNLIKAFKNNLDIHKFTASLLFGVAQEKIEESQRNTAKKVNFGIVYGMSSYGLSRELGIGLDKAQKFIENYFRRYPRVKKYVENIIDQAEKKGYVETIFKRRRILNQIKGRNPYLKEFAKRQAVNAPIQGSCADIIKLAMVKINREISNAGIKAKLIMQIHDELVFDVEKKYLEQLIFLMKSQMENCVSLRVPLKVNVKAGRDWAGVESWEDSQPIKKALGSQSTKTK